MIKAINEPPYNSGSKQTGKPAVLYSKPTNNDTTPINLQRWVPLIAAQATLIIVPIRFQITPAISWEVNI